MVPGRDCPSASFNCAHFIVSWELCPSGCCKNEKGRRFPPLLPSLSFLHCGATILSRRIHSRSSSCITSLVIQRQISSWAETTSSLETVLRGHTKLLKDFT